MSATDFTPAHAPRIDLRHLVLAGVASCLVLVGVLGGWSATTVIGGAIIANGEVAVAGHAKSIQHPDGGTVATIAVENGDRVEKGQVLVTLDSTMVAASLEIARRRLAGALALQARLKAENSGAARIDFTLPALLPGIDPASLPLGPEIAGQQDIFRARSDVLGGGRDRLEQTLAQIDDQIAGTRAQLTAVEEQSALIEPQIETKRDLIDKGLARRTEITALLNSQAQLDGRHAQLSAELARLAAAKRQSEVETRQTEHGFREDVATRLSETEGQIEELQMEILTRQSLLARMDIRAPAAGVVHELQVTTIGGVVSPGATLLEIVPSDSGFSVEVQVAPVSVDQVHPGQDAELVFPGLDRQDTPRLKGEVRTVSAAAVEDERRGRSFYRVEIAVSPEEFARLGDKTPVPGMPVEAYLTTGDRTVLHYLLEPITSHLRRAFRD